MKISNNKLCPSCQKSNIVLNKKTKMWQCKKCHYQISMQDIENTVFWFCDKCNSFLNTQKNFDQKVNFHTCEYCGEKNEIVEKNVNNTFILANWSVSFIKKYVLPNIKITIPITDDSFEKEIFEFATQCEINYANHVCCKNYNYKTRTRDVLAISFIDEISNQWRFKDVDIIDLNKKLGFIK